MYYHSVPKYPPPPMYRSPPIFSYSSFIGTLYFCLLLWQNLAIRMIKPVKAVVLISILHVGVCVIIASFATFLGTASESVEIVHLCCICWLVMVIIWKYCDPMKKALPSFAQC